MLKSQYRQFISLVRVYLRGPMTAEPPDFLLPFFTFLRWDRVIRRERCLLRRCRQFKLWEERQAATSMYLHWTTCLTYWAIKVWKDLATFLDWYSYSIPLVPSVISSSLFSSLVVPLPIHELLKGILGQAVGAKDTLFDLKTGIMLAFLI